MSRSRARKYQLTFNNPSEHGETHDVIKEKLMDINPKYWCMCDEKGETYHTHLYIHFENPREFNSLKKLFPSAHFESCNGTAKENRDYIRKEGKYADTDKAETNLIDTFEESGELPEEKQGKRTDIAIAREMLEDGCSVNEVIKEYPQFMTQRKSLEDYRLSLQFEKFRTIERDITVIYQWGETGTGKSRSVYAKHGYENVYSVNNYKHPFDGYDGEPVIVFEEFRGQIPISEMLQYLDRYPCKLPARYNDKVACYTTVYINSNLPLDKQYLKEKKRNEECCKAFYRRINEDIYYERK